MISKDTMKKITSFYLIPLLLCSIITSCDIGRRKSADVEKIKLLRGQYDSLLMAVDSAWHKMMFDDDEKIFYMKRLLQEVYLTFEYDSMVYAELVNRVEKLKNVRYTRESMKDGSLIDEYDNMTSEVINKISSFASTHPNFQNYPLMAELITEINEKDDQVILFRIQYDFAAKDYNLFIQQHGSLMDQIVPEGGYTILGLFSLGGEGV
jgi:hypothetical protein